MITEQIEIITADLKFPTPFTQRVQILCQEKNIPYRLLSINFEQKPDWFLAIAPLQQIPVMRINKEIVITDSRAITEYLDSLATPHFIATEPLQRAQHHAMIAFADELAQEITQLIKQKKSAVRDFKRLDNLLMILNKQITGPYYFGNEFSFVDIALISHLLWIHALEESVLPFSLLQKHAAVYQWFQLMCARPSVKEIMGTDFSKHFIERIKEKGLLTQFD